LVFMDINVFDVLVKVRHCTAGMVLRERSHMVIPFVNLSEHISYFQR
jgi:hypothetical protein